MANMCKIVCHPKLRLDTYQSTRKNICSHLTRRGRWENIFKRHPVRSSKSNRLDKSNQFYTALNTDTAGTLQMPNLDFYQRYFIRLYAGLTIAVILLLYKAQFCMTFIYLN